MDYQKRVEKLRKLFTGAGLDALLISYIPNITYLTGFSNFTNLEREVFLLITLKAQFIITDGRYSEAVLGEIKHFKLLEITANSPFKDLAENLAKKYEIKKLGLEEDDISFAEYKTLKPFFKKITNFNVSEIRIIKDKGEIDLIYNACQIGDQGFEYILKKIKKGASEKELAHELEYFFRKKGADLSFEPIVAFGNHSSVPHHQTSKIRLEEKNGQFILLDFGVKFENYCSDMTRTVFFGQAGEKQKHIYNVVLQAQEKAVEFINKKLMLKEKIPAKSADLLVREYIKSKGYPNIPHSLGHGIGLMVHEPASLTPKSKHDLLEGMVFSIEPGIYIPGFGGVRIEDLFVIEGNTLKQLTNSSKNLIEL